MNIELFRRKHLVARATWHFRIRATNGQIIAASQGYSRRLDAKATAEHLRDNLAGADVHDA